LFEQSCGHPSQLSSKVRIVGGVQTVCDGMKCSFSCASADDQFSGQSSIMCKKSKKKMAIVPPVCGARGKPCVIECGPPKDTVCGNFPAVKNAQVTSECKDFKMKKMVLKKCNIKCNDPKMIPTVPQLTCNLNSKKFVPLKNFACKPKPDTTCGNLSDNFVVVGGSIGACVANGAASSCPVMCNDDKQKPSSSSIKCTPVKKKKKAIPTWEPRPPRGGKTTITCAAVPEAPEADKNVAGGSTGGSLTANGNLVTPGCGKVLDKKNKAIKKSKIKIDPVSTFTNCVGNVCHVSCKPGRVFDKGSKGVVNGVIKVTCNKGVYGPKAQKAKCRTASRSEMDLMFDDQVNNDTTKCSNSIYEKFNTSPSAVEVNCVNSKCKVTCRSTGQPARHQWPDGKIAQYGTYICKGFKNWSPVKGSIVC